MVNEEKQFEEFVSGMKFNDEPNPIHRDRLEEELLATMRNQPRQEKVWRIIMKSTITKFAAAAVIIVAAIAGITIVEKTTKPAWAIEQTVNVLKNFNAIHCSGTMLDEQGKEVFFEAWAKANKDQTASDNFRIEDSTGQIEVVSKTKRYTYDPQTNTVNITEGYGPAIGIWWGANFFESMKKMSVDWKESYGTDPATGRERVFVTGSHPATPSPRSFWIEFDVESKLPISFKQWENMSWRGAPRFYVTSITYLDDLPDEMFRFETPEGAKVVPYHPEKRGRLQDPNTGMAIGSMTEDEATKEIVRRYWQAVIDEDWDTVALQYPTATAEEWENKYHGGNLTEIVEIGKPYQQGKNAKVVTCTIRFENAITQKINVIVLFRQIYGQRSCVIANTWLAEAGSE